MPYGNAGEPRSKGWRSDQYAAIVIGPQLGGTNAEFKGGVIHYQTYMWNLMKSTPNTESMAASTFLDKNI